MSVEENVFSIPVSDFCRRELISCSVNDRVLDAAAAMREKGVSSVVVYDDGAPVGIITDRDLRNKVVAAGADPRALKARAVMNAPLIVVKENDIFFEVIYKMSRHGIHRVGVVDEDNRLCGMVNEADLIRVQSKSPQQLVRELETARSIDDLKATCQGIQDLALFLSRAGVKTRDMVRLISHLNDQVVLRLVAILRAERFPSLPDGFAFLVLGSEGRGEQTLKTDQDNAMIYADHLSEEEVRVLESFSHALVDALIEIGVPECPGGIMAKNPFWRRSLSEWLKVVEGWISIPDGENTLNFSMFSDMRLVCGDPSLVQEIKDYIARRTREETLFLMRMADKALRFAPPLGFFGGFKVEKGEHLGQIDLKKAGIYAISEGIKVLGFSVGILGGGTLEKIAKLQQKGVLSAEQAKDLEASFNLLCYLRLRGQVEAISTGGELSNYIAPDGLNRVERGQFHVTLEVVKSFETFLKSHFRLHLITY